MERYEKLYSNAKKYVQRINELIDLGYWILIYDKDNICEGDDQPFILRSRLYFNDEKKEVAIMNGGSKYMIWGDGWNDSISYLKERFNGSKIIHPKDLKDFKL